MGREVADSPTELPAASWRSALRRTVGEFRSDQCTDLAAALTYYAVLSVFPAMVALVSLLGVVGQGRKTVDTALGVLRDLGASSMADTLRPSFEHIAASKASGWALVIGVLGALWSASGYVGAFGRALNRVYEVAEGRRFWVLRPMQLLVTLVTLLLAAAVLLGLVLTGSVARAVGDAVGVGSTAVTVFSIVKWPVMAAAAVLVVALLYYATPNVRQPGFRWISPGALAALLVWALASVLFGLYVAHFASYDKTYGSLAGVAVFLLWLWITNLALLFGAELDAELERSRELRAGLPAEDEIQLPPRRAEQSQREDRADRR